MKFTVELEDFWLEGEHGAEEIQDELKQYIIRDVVHQIRKGIKDQIDTEIVRAVREEVEECLTPAIKHTVADEIEKGVIRIKKGYSGDYEEKPISEYICEQFHASTGWNRPEEKIAKIAKSFGEELKLQYNNAFANQIVHNMKEQGLLKDEVVQILLEGK